MRNTEEKTVLLQGINQILKVENQPISFSRNSFSKLNPRIANKQVSTSRFASLQPVDKYSLHQNLTLMFIVAWMEDDSTTEHLNHISSSHMEEWSYITHPCSMYLQCIYIYNSEGINQPVDKCIVYIYIYIMYMGVVVVVSVQENGDVKLFLPQDQLHRLQS